MPRQCRVMSCSYRRLHGLARAERLRQSIPGGVPRRERGVRVRGGGGGEQRIDEVAAAAAAKEGPEADVLLVDGHAGHEPRQLNLS